MTKLFPSAVDYRTVTTRIAPEQRAAIERETGSELLPGQRDQFTYFALLGAKGRTLGHVIAASQKGEFGAIEFVMGLDSAGKVNGMYIQRSRERDVAFKETAFVDSFKGIASGARGELVKRARAEENRGKRAVLQGVLKELVAFQTLAAKQ